MDLSFFYGNSYVGVLLGLSMFGMGYWKGAMIRRTLVEAIISTTINQMIADKLVRTRRIWNPTINEWEEEIVRFDEV